MSDQICDGLIHGVDEGGERRRKAEEGGGRRGKAGDGIGPGHVIPAADQ